MTGLKSRYDKIKKIKIIQSIFFDHSGMKLEINNNKKFGKFINM